MKPTKEPDESSETTSSRSPPRFVISVQTTAPELVKEKKNDTVHVLVIAHPDDESMFFLPTLSALRDAGETVWILCLTTGNYNGLGQTRKGELSKVCSLLKMDRLIQLDVEALQDHPTQSWSLDAVTAEIERALSTAIRNCANPIRRLKLITFDVDGVSGHINHRDTHWGVRNLICKHSKNSKLKEALGPKSKYDNTPKTMVLPPMEAWQLETVHFLPIKYLPILEWALLLSYCFWLWKPTYAPLPSSTSHNSPTHVYRSVDCRQSWRAMATHHSQWVWYRRLFVIFSCYTFVNKLRPVQWK